MILKDMKLELQLKPTFAFTALIKKGQYKTLGVGMDCLKSGTCLLITDIGDGPIDDWNKANPGKDVRPDDQIIGVDHVVGTSLQLADAMKSSNQFNLHIVRPVC